MRKAILLLLLLAFMAAPDYAAAERDFEVGVKNVLGYQPDLPRAAETSKSLKDILSRPEFSEEDKTAQGPSLLDRILQWIARHLGGLGAGLMGAGVTTLVITGVVIAAVLVLLVYVVVRAMWARMSSTAEDPSDLAEENLTASGFRDLAHKYALAGDHLPALRYRFRAVVGELDVLDPERQTNWQLLRHIRKMHPDAIRDFMELTGLFEDCWYGGRKATAEEYARADRLAEAIEKVMVPHEAAA